MRNDASPFDALRSSRRLLGRAVNFVCSLGIPASRPATVEPRHGHTTPQTMSYVYILSRPIIP